MPFKNYLPQLYVEESNEDLKYTLVKMVTSSGVFNAVLLGDFNGDKTLYAVRKVNDIDKGDIDKAATSIPKKEVKSITKITGRITAIIPGRFQPFHKGHLELYKKAKQKYGDNVYIATTAKDDSKKHPLSFEQKIKLIKAAGISEDKILKVKDPYSVLEYGRGQNLFNSVTKYRDSLVFVTSSKDSDRNVGDEEAPSNSTDMKSVASRGVGKPYSYRLVLETSKKGSTDLSATQIRDAIKEGKFQSIADMLPYSVDELKSVFDTKEEPKQEKEIKTQGKDLHIEHIEVVLLKNGEAGKKLVEEFLDGMINAPKKIKITQKIEGIPIAFGYEGKEFKVVLKNKIGKEEVGSLNEALLSSISPSLKKLDMTGVIFAELMYPTKKSDKTFDDKTNFLKFQPHDLTYGVSKENNIFLKINDSKVGILLISQYDNFDFENKKDIGDEFINKNQKVKDVFMFDGKLNYDFKNEIDFKGLNTFLSELKKINILPSEYREGKKLGITKVQDYVDNNKNELSRYLKILRNIKSIILKKFKEVETIVSFDPYSGQRVSEGVVATINNTVVKLVDHGDFGNIMKAKYKSKR